MSKKIAAGEAEKSKFDLKSLRVSQDLETRNQACLRVCSRREAQQKMFLPYLPHTRAVRAFLDRGGLPYT